MNKDPLVSVIMNCYNGDKFLKDAIDSVYSQTYENWEIIFWDNASNDQSDIIAKSYDHKLRYFRADQNTILGKARVLAVKEANGEYLAFLDCDDCWNRDKLKKQIEILNDDLGIIYSKSEVISGNGKILGTIPINHGTPVFGEVFGELSKENFIPFVSALVPTDKYFAVGGFSEKYKTAVDYDLFLKLSYSYRVEYIDEILCKYRQHSGNLSLVQKSLGIEESIRTIESFLPNNLAQIGVNHHYAILFINYVKEKKFYKALLVLIKKDVFRLVFLRITKKLKN